MNDGVAGSNDRVPLSNANAGQMPPLPPLGPTQHQYVPQNHTTREGNSAPYGVPSVAAPQSEPATVPGRGRAKKPRTPEQKRRRRRIALVTVPLVLVAAAAILPPLVNQANLEDYRTQHSKLETTVAQSLNLTEDAPAGFEASLIDAITSDIDDAEALLAADDPSPYSFTIRAHADEFYEARHDMLDLTDELSAALDSRDTFIDYVVDAEAELADAQELHEVTSGQVLDDGTRSTLADAIDSLEWELGLDSDFATGEEYEDAYSNLVTVVDDVRTASSDVETDNESWVVAEEEKAKTDPANYATISDRDWQLMERNGDSHAGEKYVIYGYVTQSDSAMGQLSIRANTSGEKMSQWYDYEINTLVYTSDIDMFDNVLADDEVKMLVEVIGSTSYDTTIGGTATALEVQVFSIEVIG